MINPVNFIKSLNWNKEDLKKFIFCITLILIFCIALKVTLTKVKIWVVGDIGISNSNPSVGTLQVDATVTDITVK